MNPLNIEDPDEEKVLNGEQCMACRFDINDGEAMGFPRVCDECAGDLAIPESTGGD